MGKRTREYTTRSTATFNFAEVYTSSFVFFCLAEVSKTQLPRITIHSAFMLNNHRNSDSRNKTMSFEIQIPQSHVAVLRDSDLHRLALISLSQERLVNNLISVSATEPDIARLGGEPLRFEKPSEELQRASHMITPDLLLLRQQPQQQHVQLTNRSSSSNQKSEDMIKRAILRPKSADFLHFLSLSIQNKFTLQLLANLPSMLATLGQIIFTTFLDDAQCLRRRRCDPSPARAAPSIIMQRFQQKYVTDIIHSVTHIVCSEMVPIAIRELAAAINHSSENPQFRNAAADVDDDASSSNSGSSGLILDQRMRPGSLLRHLSTACIVLAEGIESEFQKMKDDQTSGVGDHPLFREQLHLAALEQFVTRLKHTSQDIDIAFSRTLC